MRDQAGDIEPVGGGRACRYGAGDRVAPKRQVDAPTATFTGPLEAAMRLIAGRLGPTHTPSDVTVTGNVTLEDLRAVFPGY